MRTLLMVFLIIIAGCAGKIDYVRPSLTEVALRPKVIDKPRDAVWNASVPELSKQFYIINNLDKSSGLINVSYSGNPEDYIDCGRIISYVKNSRGERTYDFPAARAHQEYEQLNDKGLFFIERHMSLEGRINLIFEEISPTSTKITANTRYVLTRQQTARNAANNFPQSRTDAISFNSGGGASFPAHAGGQAVECISTGKLEREILDLIK